jgi:hypothetical protein
MPDLFKRLLPWRSVEDSGQQYPSPMAEAYKRSSRELIRRQFDEDIKQAEEVIERLSGRRARE